MLVIGNYLYSQQFVIYINMWLPTYCGLGLVLWCLAPLSAILWQSVLLVEGNRSARRENHRPAASHCQILSHNVVLGTPRHELDCH